MQRQDELHHGHRSVAGGAARAAVFGVSDGLVSNVSLIIGFAGGGADSSVVRLAGLAGAVAGGISMAAGEWVSVSAQNELIERELEVERRELNLHPAAETEELAAMYEADGMEPDRAKQAAADVMRMPAEALAVHARAELGVDPGKLPSPMAAATSSLVCFLFGALLPVVPWLFDVSGTAPTISSLGDRHRRRRLRRGDHRPLGRPVGPPIDDPPRADRARRLRRDLRRRPGRRHQRVLAGTPTRRSRNLDGSAPAAVRTSPQAGLDRPRPRSGVFGASEAIYA